MPNDTLEFIADGFSEVSLQNGACAWIDVLGTRNGGFNRKQVEQLLDIATIVSSTGRTTDTGMYQAASNALANVTIVGDAICVSQKSPGDDFKYVRDAVGLVATFISQNLFMHGISHRGAIAQGTLEVGTRHGIRFTSGEAVLNAMRLEQMMKTTGIVVAKDLLAEAKGWQVPSSEEPFFFYEKFGHQYISFKAHAASWKLFCETNREVHPYIAASLVVIS